MDAPLVVLELGVGVTVGVVVGVKVPDGDTHAATPPPALTGVPSAHRHVHAGWGLPGGSPHSAAPHDWNGRVEGRL